MGQIMEQRSPDNMLIKEMRINLTCARNLYIEGGEDVKKALDILLGNVVKEPYYWIKTLDDAVNYLGCSHPLVQTRNVLLNSDTELLDNVINAVELKIICAALNKNKSVRLKTTVYYPKFKVIDKSEAQLTNPEWVDAHNPVPCEGGEQIFTYMGVDYMICDYFAGDLDLAYIYQEVAEYAGKQFIEYYQAHFRLYQKHKY